MLGLKRFDKRIFHFTHRSGHCCDVFPLNSSLFLDFHSSMLFPMLPFHLLARPVVDFCPLLPSSHPHSPKTFASSVNARFYRPPTRQFYVSELERMRLIKSASSAWRSSISIYLYLVFPSHVSAVSLRWPKKRPFIKVIKRSASSASAIVI